MCVCLLLAVFRSFGILLITFQAKLVILSLLNVLLVLISLLVSCGSQVLFEFLQIGQKKLVSEHEHVWPKIASLQLAKGNSKVRPYLDKGVGVLVDLCLVQLVLNG